MAEYHCTFEQVHARVKKIALQIQAAGFTPDYLVAIGAGGFVPARLFRNYFTVPILVITVASYHDQKKIVTGKIEKIQWLPNHMITQKKILVIDDIDDTRLTLQYCLTELYRAQPEEIRLFVLHDKMGKKQGSFPEALQHIYVGDVVQDQWITYPWEHA